MPRTTSHRGARRSTRARAAVAAALATPTLALAGLVGLPAAASAEDGAIDPAAAAVDVPVAVALDAVLDPVVRTFAAQARGASATVVALVEEATPPAPACPVPTAEFIDSWGFARSGGRRHKGVDMMAPYGDPVLATVAGTIRPSNSSLGGLGFYLEDDEGNTYFGSHLARLDVTSGRVEAGQQLGTVGTTGNASTPHLHFEVMLAGRGSVNPYPFAAEWCSDPAPAVADLAGLPAPDPEPAAAVLDRVPATEPARGSRASSGPAQPVR